MLSEPVPSRFRHPGRRMGRACQVERRCQTKEEQVDAVGAVACHEHDCTLDPVGRQHIADEVDQQTSRWPEPPTRRGPEGAHAARGRGLAASSTRNRAFSVTLRGEPATVVERGEPADCPREPERSGAGVSRRRLPIGNGLMYMVARNHCSRRLARGLHGHTIARKTLQGLEIFVTLLESLIYFSPDSKWGLRCLPIR